ncbi:MAG: hypothetical protein ABIR46_00660 [Candidatus Saccharimonadales bacterium]
MKAFKNSTKLQILAVVLVSLVGFGAVYGYTKYSNSNSPSQSSCKDTCVALGIDGAAPNSIAVALNSYVQFNSADGKSHNLSLGEGGEEHEHTGKFNSGVFKADEGWRVQFKDEGTFIFHDHFNPKINVVVVVYEPGKEYKVE